MKIKIALSWSGGKDACLALQYLIKSKQYIVDHLHTAVGKETDRVGMHGIKRELIEAQAKSLGIPIHISILPSDQSNQSYEQVMRTYAHFCKSKGIDTVAFGDIYLDDLKKYREKIMAENGIKCIFPLWKKPTMEVITEFLELGYKTLICAADASKIKKQLVGHKIDAQILKSLAPNVDPCGENGEFHTFVYDGPIFSKSINLRIESIESHIYKYQIEKEGKNHELKSEFYFAELK